MKVFNKDKALRQIKLKQNKNTYIKKVSIVLSCFILIIVIIMFTFAKFEQNSEEYTLINGVVKYGGSGDIQLSYVVDGVSQSAPPAKGTGYKIKNINCTNGTGTWSNSRWSIEVSNITGKVKCNLEFETATSVNVTMYGPPGAVISYTDSLGSNTQTMDSTGKKENVEIGIMNNITFEDTTVAKDPNNLSNNYTKTINVTEDTTEIYIMPNNTLYWYGYESNNLEDMSTSNGWSPIPFNAFTGTIQRNTNYIYINTNQENGVGTKNKIKFKQLHYIIHPSNMDSDHSMNDVDMGSASTKMRFAYNPRLKATGNVLQYVTNEPLAEEIESYVGIDVLRSCTVKLYALWYE